VSTFSASDLQAAIYASIVQDRAKVFNKITWELDLGATHPMSWEKECADAYDQAEVALRIFLGQL
jgi:hypothetical protein